MPKSFIPWAGGDQPMPDLSHVQVKFRNPDHDTDENFYAHELDWVHVDGDGDKDYDIIAYRTSDIQPVFQIWTGGLNPAGVQTVEYALRANQRVILTTTANFIDWTHEPEDPDADIVLYRIIH